MLRRKPAAVGVVDVDHAQLWIACEQASLGLEVVLHRGVEVEVVLGQVGEQRGGEVGALDSLLGERVGGDLDRGRTVAAVEHRAQARLQVD
jgi:hypothetical protein